MTKNYHIPLLTATLLALLVGYADLARGGITLGPVALVVAYCALVPATIWRWPPAAAARRGDAVGGPRPSYLAAAVAGSVVFALYLATLAPTTALWDTSEYIAAAYVVGIPHPPGNPLFVLVGRVFALLPIAPTVAVRINVLAALCSAVAAGMWFLVTERAVVSWLPARWQRIVVGALGAVIGATAFTVWNQSVVNEKVYTVSLMGIAICSWLVVRWLDDPEGPRAPHLLVLAAYLMGLGYANHMAGMLAAPATAIAVLACRPRTILRWRLIVLCVAAVGVGMSVFATQPIRSAWLPPINEGEPTACTRGRGFQLDCTFTGETWERFKYNFNREQYGKPPLGARQAPFGAQLEMWWLYFKWQWLRDAYAERPGLQALLGAMFLALGLYGGAMHHRRSRGTFWYFAPLVVTMSVLLVYYMNFKYGASQAPHLGDAVEREVRDRDYFFIWSFSSWGVWAALGLAGIWDGIARALAMRPARGAAPTRAVSRHLVAAPVLAVALVPLLLNWNEASRRGHTDARDFAIDLLNSVEPYAILLVAGDNDSFPLWYAQEVEGIRRDVLVVTDMLLNTDWHLRQVIRRRADAYDRAKGPAIYRDGAWVRPDGPAIRMTQDEADSLPPFIPVRGPQVFRRNGLEAVIDPRNLPRDANGTGYLQRSEGAILRMIADSWPARPVYFSRTSGNLAQKLGLERHLVAHGLARKLVAEPPAPSADVVATSEGLVDVVRSVALWNDVYIGPKAYAHRDGWVDRASISIPFSYVATGWELAAILRSVGRAAEADGVLATVGEVVRATRLEQLVPALAGS